MIVLDSCLMIPYVQRYNVCAMPPLEQFSVEFLKLLALFCISMEVIGLKTSRHFLHLSDVNSKRVVSPSHMFSRPSHKLHLFASSFDWLPGLSVG